MYWEPEGLPRATKRTKAAIHQCVGWLCTWDYNWLDCLLRTTRWREVGSVACKAMTLSYLCPDVLLLFSLNWCPNLLMVGLPCLKRDWSRWSMTVCTLQYQCCLKADTANGSKVFIYIFIAESSAIFEMMLTKFQAMELLSKEESGKTSLLNLTYGGLVEFI